jgi:hypothetical protein
MKEELEKHPALQDLEDGSTKDGSVPPSVSAGTPQATSTAPRIKLVSSSANGTKESNGGSAAAQSDED